jgi:putative transposase
MEEGAMDVLIERCAGLDIGKKDLKACVPPEITGRAPRVALDAEAQLTALARELDKTHPGAAASLREGMAETLTVLRLDVPPTLARTLRSTNAIESMISICRQRSANVKRRRDGQMALRWCAAGMLEAGKQFRRVNGHLHLPKLRAALDAETAGTVAPDLQDEEVVAA